MSVRTKLHRLWERLRTGEPGRRFQDRYDRTARRGKPKHPVLRALKIVGAVVIIVIGLVEIFFPGPAIVFLFIGGGLLASEFRWAARLMDWIELRVRRLWGIIVGRWRTIAPGTRHMVVGLVVCAGAAGVFLMYRVVSN